MFRNFTMSVVTVLAVLCLLVSVDARTVDGQRKTSLRGLEVSRTHQRGHRRQQSHGHAGTEPGAAGGTDHKSPDDILSGGNNKMLDYGDLLGLLAPYTNQVGLQRSIEAAYEVAGTDLRSKRLHELNRAEMRLLADAVTAGEYALLNETNTRMCRTAVPHGAFVFTQGGIKDTVLGMHIGPLIKANMAELNSTNSDIVGQYLFSLIAELTAISAEHMEPLLGFLGGLLDIEKADKWATAILDDFVAKYKHKYSVEQVMREAIVQFTVAKLSLNLGRCLSAETKEEFILITEHIDEWADAMVEDIPEFVDVSAFEENVAEEILIALEVMIRDLFSDVHHYEQVIVEAVETNDGSKTIGALLSLMEDTLLLITMEGQHGSGVIDKGGLTPGGGGGDKNIPHHIETTMKPSFGSASKLPIDTGEPIEDAKTLLKPLIDDKVLLACEVKGVLKLESLVFQPIGDFSDEELLVFSHACRVIIENINENLDRQTMCEDALPMHTFTLAQGFLVNFLGKSVVPLRASVSMALANRLDEDILSKVWQRVMDATSDIAGQLVNQMKPLLAFTRTLPEMSHAEVVSERILQQFLHQVEDNVVAGRLARELAFMMTGFLTTFEKTYCVPADTLTSLDAMLNEIPIILSHAVSTLTDVEMDTSDLGGDEIQAIYESLMHGVQHVLVAVQDFIMVERSAIAEGTDMELVAAILLLLDDLIMDDPLSIWKSNTVLSVEELIEVYTDHLKYIDMVPIDVERLLRSFAANIMQIVDADTVSKALLSAMNQTMNQTMNYSIEAVMQSVHIKITPRR